MNTDKPNRTKPSAKDTPTKPSPDPVVNEQNKFTQLKTITKTFNDAVDELSRNKTAFEKEKKIMEKFKIDDVVELNVGGCRFTTYKSTLVSPLTAGSMISAMFSGRHQLRQDANGCYFIDRPSDPFKWILDCLRTGVIIKPSSPLRRQVLIELEYYGLDNPFFDCLYLTFDTNIPLDDDSITAFHTWIGENKTLQLLYRCSSNSSNFHNLCDNKSPTLTLMLSHTGYIFGGYTECTWDQSSGYKNGSTNTSSWLFSLVNPSKTKPTRYFANSTSNQIHCNSGNGPTFGAGYDMVVSLNNSVSFSTSSTYPTNGNSMIAASSVTLKEWEVFLVINK